MDGVGLQLHTGRQRTKLRQMEVCKNGAVIGHIARSREGRMFRYFPGADNDIAFVYEHRNLQMLIQAIENRSWELELDALRPAAG
jgi:hypothetical protein